MCETQGATRPPRPPRGHTPQASHLKRATAAWLLNASNNTRSLLAGPSHHGGPGLAVCRSKVSGRVLRLRPPPPWGLRHRPPPPCGIFHFGVAVEAVAENPTSASSKSQTAKETHNRHRKGGGGCMVAEVAMNSVRFWTPLFVD